MGSTPKCFWWSTLPHKAAHTVDSQVNRRTWYQPLGLKHGCVHICIPSGSQTTLGFHGCRLLCLVIQSCLTPWTVCSLPGSSVHGDPPDKNTGVGCHTLLQGIFPTQGSKPGLPHCKWILYCLSHQGSPGILEWVAYPFSTESS